MSEVVDCAVIGCGFAGIAAALELTMQGRRPVVFESLTVAGGRARSVSTRAGLLPGGPSSFTGRTVAMWWLIDRLGLRDEVVEACGGLDKRFIQRNHALHGLRQSPLSLLTTTALTTSEKLTLAKRFSGAPSPVVGESLQQFFETQLGVSLAGSVGAAFVAGILGSPPGELSAEDCFPELVERAKTHGGLLKALRAKPAVKPPKESRGIFTFRGGLQTVIEKAATLFDVRLGHSVLGIVQSPEGFELRLKDAHLTAKSLVMATESDAVSTLLPHPDIAQQLLQIKHVPLTVVHWKRADGQPAFSKGFGFLAVPGDNSFSLGTLFLGDILGQTATYATLVGGGFHPERCGLSEQQTFDGVRSDLEALGVAGPLECMGVTHWPKAVVIPSFGHRARAAALVDSFSKCFLNAALAGSYLGTGTLRDAIETGRAAAQRLGALAIA